MTHDRRSDGRRANAEQRVVFLKDPAAPEGLPPTAVDELRLREMWSGEAILIRATRVRTKFDALLSFAWVSSSLSDLNVKSLISLKFAFSSLTENCNDINMLSISRTPSSTGC